MEIDFKIINDRDVFGSIERAPAIAVHLLREAIDDIADRVEEEARRNVPEGPSGELKAHPIDRDDARISEAELGLPSIGGGFTARGTGGRFIAGGLTEGRIVARAQLTVAKEPRHAKWVHDGTGIYGPRGIKIRPRTKPAMFFEGYGDFEGQKIVAKRTKGQRPQPYLKNAFQHINNTYALIRFEELKQQIELVT